VTSPPCGYARRRYPAVFMLTPVVVVKNFRIWNCKFIVCSAGLCLKFSTLRYRPDATFRELNLLPSLMSLYGFSANPVVSVSYFTKREV
jgi:hypothetical protein